MTENTPSHIQTNTTTDFFASLKRICSQWFCLLAACIMFFDFFLSFICFLFSSCYCQLMRKYNFCAHSLNWIYFNVCVDIHCLLSQDSMRFLWFFYVFVALVYVYYSSMARALSFHIAIRLMEQRSSNIKYQFHFNFHHVSNVHQPSYST